MNSQTYALSARVAPCGLERKWTFRPLPSDRTKCRFRDSINGACCQQNSSLPYIRLHCCRIQVAGKSAPPGTCGSMKENARRWRKEPPEIFSTLPPSRPEARFDHLVACRKAFRFFGHGEWMGLESALVPSVARPSHLHGRGVGQGCADCARGVRMLPWRPFQHPSGTLEAETVAPGKQPKCRVLASNVLTAKLHNVHVPALFAFPGGVSNVSAEDVCPGSSLLSSTRKGSGHARPIHVDDRCDHSV